MKIRRFEPQDAEQIRQLFYDTVHTINARDYSKEQVDAWAPEALAADKWGQMLAYNISYVAEQDSVIIGFGDLARNGYINCLYAHKDFQRKGVGSGLLAQLETEARALGLTEVFAEASITARPFFLAQGYQCVQSQNKEHNGSVFLNYVMKKRLL
ncbi:MULTISPECIES: GNAT family N-acetyltransferase [Aneurinibacillus]|uniref:Acetyltransferase, GNAT family n=1 Tax=Aneurinibacillus thermoaerophilus TaxID=143495 RepID=A0A1G7WWN5_ANETH|nr:MULTISPECIES: GNAT family N-acetyltransferase [Aneurinibacillus]AMA73914.1 acetyltransferase [Aneurinibacillus sp. XH2]MED0674100.1 GNAT family N-acetyltransferase [Aneurinibacillus thermoaerophilus]MED0678086.1 GNAT family N-acetyltransferase [Aneurinibacillus thermoaerophilus]MED0737724.1 GNAT family N-acetyltransferase [Aneurinibacillus thermoaerophilus]MED0755711.1 GNAT family N-acetyltransferase [Aneurinibacillus thermoaerophilus]